MRSKIIKLVHLFTVMIFFNSSVVVQSISKDKLKKIGIGVGVAVGAAALAGGVGYGLRQRSKSKELAMQGKVIEQPVVDVQKKTPRPPNYPNPNAKPKLVSETTYLSTAKYGPHYGNVPPPPNTPPPPLPASESKVVVSPSVPVASVLPPATVVADVQKKTPRPPSYPNPNAKPQIVQEVKTDKYEASSIPVYVPGGAIPPPPPLPASESKVVVSPSASVASVIPTAPPAPNLPKSKADKYGASAVKQSLVGPPGGAPLIPSVPSAPKVLSAIPEAPPAPKVVPNKLIETPKKEEPKIEAKKEAPVLPALPFSPANLQDVKGKLKKSSERESAKPAEAQKPASSAQDFLQQAILARRGAIAGDSDKRAAAIGQGPINKNVISASPKVIENKPIVNVQNIPFAKVVPVAPVAPALQKDVEVQMPRVNVVRPSANALQGAVLKKVGEAKEVKEPVAPKPVVVNVGLQQAMQRREKIEQKGGKQEVAEDEWED